MRIVVVRKLVSSTEPKAKRFLRGDKSHGDKMKDDKTQVDKTNDTTNPSYDR